MRTILDDAYTWFLESLSYRDELRVAVVEGIKSDTPEDIEIGGVVLKDTFAVEPTQKSRRVGVRFAGVIAWQVVDESYAGRNESEESDGPHKLVVLTNSSYFHYVRTTAGTRTCAAQRLTTVFGPRTT